MVCQSTNVSIQILTDVGTDIIQHDPGHSLVKGWRLFNRNNTQTAWSQCLPSQVKIYSRGRGESAVYDVHRAIRASDFVSAT